MLHVQPAKAVWIGVHTDDLAGSTIEAVGWLVRFDAGDQKTRRPRGTPTSPSAIWSVLLKQGTGIHSRRVSGAEGRPAHSGYAGVFRAEAAEHAVGPATAADTATAEACRVDR
jgi:hypothetical protein